MIPECNDIHLNPPDTATARAPPPSASSAVGLQQRLSRSLPVRLSGPWPLATQRHHSHHSWACASFGSSSRGVAGSVGESMATVLVTTLWGSELSVPLDDPVACACQASPTSLAACVCLRMMTKEGTCSVVLDALNSAIVGAIVDAAVGPEWRTTNSAAPAPITCPLRASSTAGTLSTLAGGTKHE